MTTREELINSKEYWITQFQLQLFEEIKKYMSENNLNQSQLAQRLGVTKGYISQILNGDFDHKVSKLVELSLAIGKAPKLTFEDINQQQSPSKSKKKTNPMAIAA
jgi:transcriptional regulator with XRE-family HTH domain